MPHSVEVDQSRKVEQSGSTVLGFSDGISQAIVIPSDVKREVLEVLQQKGKSRETARLLLFSACLYLLLKDHLKNLQRVIIDEEYTGQAKNIKSFLLEYIRRGGQFFDAAKIDFARVGKSSPAHKKAWAVRTGKDKKFRKVTLKELLRVVG